MYQKFIAKFNTISFTIIVILAALLPLFFLPGTWSGLQAAKGLLLYSGVFLAFSFWLLAQFVQGTFQVQKHKVLMAVGAWVVLVLVSALTSRNISVSLWGRGFVVDSFATVLVLGMFAFLVAFFAREQKRLVTLFLAAFSGSVATVFLQVVLYVSQRTTLVSKYLSHVANQGTLVGSWIDFAYFVTFTFLLALLMHEVLAPRGIFRIVSLGAMILSVLVLIFLNFTAAWIIAITSALLVFVYKSSVERSAIKFFPQSRLATPESSEKKEEPRFPISSFVALLVGLFFLLSSGSVGARIARYGGINFSDIRPSFATTMHVARSTLAHDPIFGAGAGRFNEMWNLYHPAAINQTIFWNSPFDAGFSTLSTVLVTNGALALLALLAVFAFSLIQGFRLFNHQFPDRFSRFIAVTALIMLIAFILLIALASPGLVLTAYGFVYIGLLVGVSTLIGKTRLTSFNYLADPRLSFFAILLLVVAILIGFSTVYFTANRFASIFYYNRSLIAQDFPTAQARLDRALSLSQNDFYWRTRAALFTQQFTTLAQTQNPDKAQLQNYFTQAEQSARAAVQWDTTSALNWLGLGQVYQLVAANNSTDGYTNAKQAFDEAAKRNPSNPVIPISNAQLAVLKQDSAGALAAIDEALKLKPNYLDVFVLRAQVRAASGEARAPIEEISKYVSIAPLDPQGYLLLGQAYINVKDYQSALDAFNRAKQLSPTDPTAAVSIVNTYILMGQKDQAIESLKDLKKVFPNITGIDEKITELQNSQVAAPLPTPTQNDSKPTPTKKK